jgi:hypothetical protein
MKTIIYSLLLLGLLTIAFYAFQYYRIPDCNAFVDRVAPEQTSCYLWAEIDKKLVDSGEYIQYVIDVRIKNNKNRKVFYSIISKNESDSFYVNPVNDEFSHYLTGKEDIVQELHVLVKKDRTKEKTDCGILNSLKLYLVLFPDGDENLDKKAKTIIKSMDDKSKLFWDNTVTVKIKERNKYNNKK